jgi:nucleoside-diphosphate-sugar epimerase
MRTPIVSREGPVLVTGASGHLGANLVRRLLKQGDPVRVLLRKGSDPAAVEGLAVERVYGDLRDLPSTRAAVAGCRRIYHCAAKLSTIEGDARHRREIYDCNVIGTQHLLRAALEARVERVVVTGSFSAVGHDLEKPSAPSSESMQFYPFERSMPYERYIGWCVVGALAWVLSLCGAGFFFGNLPVVKQNLTVVIGLIVLVSVSPGLIAWLKERSVQRYR